LNKENSVEEEIEEGIVMGNKAFHANSALFKNKLISKNAKLRLCNSVLKPVLTYASETWVVKYTVKKGDYQLKVKYSEEFMEHFKK
jgi:hypothetical protein